MDVRSELTTTPSRIATNYANAETFPAKAAATRLCDGRTWDPLAKRLWNRVLDTLVAGADVKFPGQDLLHEGIPLFHGRSALGEIIVPVIVASRNIAFLHMILEAIPHLLGDTSAARKRLPSPT